MTQRIPHLLLLLLLLPNIALAQTTNTEELLCGLVDFLLGGFGVALAMFAIFSIAFGMLRGKIEWSTGMIIMICITAMFASLQIVQGIASATGNGNVDICGYSGGGSGSSVPDYCTDEMFGSAEWIALGCEAFYTTEELCTSYATGSAEWDAMGCEALCASYEIASPEWSAMGC